MPLPFPGSSAVVTGVEAFGQTQGQIAGVTRQGGSQVPGAKDAFRQCVLLLGPAKIMKVKEA